MSYMSLQNGMTEHKNRSLVKRKNHVESNYIYLGSSNIRTAYVLNRCPISSVENMNPLEAWTGWKPKVMHLKVFCLVAFVHIPNEKRQQLDDNSVKCKFVGYSVEFKGYHLYNPLKMT